MKKVLYIIIGVAFATTAQAQTIIKKQLMPQQLVIDYQMPVAKPSTDYAAVVTPMICSATDTIRFQSVIVRGARNAKAMHRDMRLNHKHEAEQPYLRAKDLTADGITGQVVADLSEYPWVRTEPISLCMLTELEGCCHVNTIDISCADLGRSMVPTRVPLLRVQLSPDDYKKVRQLEGRAYIDFRVNKIDLDPNYRRNPQELKKIMATIDQVRGKKDVDIDRVTIHGYASPEGSYDHNAWLAENRAATLSKHIQKLYKFNQGVIGSTSTPEDWAGLRDYVAKSSMEERAEILSIIDGGLEPDAKDAQIKRQFPQRYQQLLADVYPGLRHSDYVIQYSIRPYTLEESRDVYRTNPEDLSFSELVALANDAGIDTEKGREIVYRAAELNPKNPRAVLLAAQTAVGQNDYALAERILPARPTDPQHAYVLGGIRKMQERYDEARALMNQALQGGVEDAQAQLEEIRLLSGE